MEFDHQNKTIETSRLLLRLFEKSDAEDVARLCNNYNLYKSTLNMPYPYDINDALSWMEHHLANFDDDKSYEFAITDKQTGTLLGAIGLSNKRSYDHGELGYWIGEAFWGNGYAPEAARSLIKFAFHEKKYHKVFARHFSSNPASGNVMEKIGMQKEGVLIEHVKKENKYEDLVCYGMVNQA